MSFSGWIRNTFHTPLLSNTLSKINRGEVLAAFLIPYILVSFWGKVGFESPFYIILYISILSFFTDRSVLVLKKIVSRRRPLVQVMGKQDENPDMKHSFPSAHSANSMVVLFVLVFAYNCSPLLLLFSFLAGLGRLLSMHHFLSDVLGGWFVGICWGFFGIWFLPLLIGFIEKS